MVHSDLTEALTSKAIKTGNKFQDDTDSWQIFSYTNFQFNP